MSTRSITLQQNKYMDTKSSSSSTNDLTINNQRLDSGYNSGLLNTYSTLASRRGSYGGNFSSDNKYIFDHNHPRSGLNESLPAYSLHKYQLDSDAMSQDNAQADCTKDVMAEESNSSSLTSREADSPRSVGLSPTWNPSSLRYIKVNLNQGKYQSWPATTTNTTLETTGTVSPRSPSTTSNNADEMTHQQRLANSNRTTSPKEGNILTSEREVLSNNSPNKSKPEGVSHKIAFFQSQELKIRSKHSDNMCNNSYVNPLRHRIFNKQHNTPIMTDSKQRRNEDWLKKQSHNSYFRHRANSIDTSLESLTQPSEHTGKNNSSRPKPNSPNQNVNNINRHEFRRSESMNGYLDSGMPVSGESGVKRDFPNDETSIGTNRAQSLFDIHGNTSSSIGVIKRNSSQSSLLSNSSNLPERHSLLRSGDSPDSKGNLTDQHSIQNMFSAQSNRSQDFQAGIDKDKTYVVRSTLCYNTSTQTDQVPSAAHHFDSPTVTPRRRTGMETQDSCLTCHTSPRMLDIKGRPVQDMCIQTIGSGDINDSSFDLRIENLLRKTPGQSGDLSGLTSLGKSTVQASHLENSNNARNDSPEILRGRYEHQGLRSSNNISNISSSNSSRLLKNMLNSRQAVISETPTSSVYWHDSPRLDYSNPGAYYGHRSQRIESKDNMANQYDKTMGSFKPDGFGSPNITDSRHTSPQYSDSQFRDYQQRSPIEYNRYGNFYVSPKENFPRDSSSSSSSDTIGDNRDCSTPVFGSNLSGQRLPQLSEGKIHDLSWTSGLGSDASSVYSYPKSIVSDRTLSRGPSFASSVDIPCHQSDRAASPSPKSKEATYQWKKIILVSPEESRHSRLGSDSVFLDDEPDSLEDDELNRTLSADDTFDFHDALGRNSYHYDVPNSKENAANHSLHILNKGKTYQQQKVPEFSKSSVPKYSNFQILEQSKERQIMNWSLGDKGSTTETVDDVISKVNENLAKSAQRVCHIRRSSSSTSRHGLDRLDTGRPERYRRETEWTRLRSLGSVSNNQSVYHSGSRRSLGSVLELFGDTRMLSSSTPRSSIAESMDWGYIGHDASQGVEDVLAASPPYQNFPSRRRPPPTPPSQSPSSGSEPPALPPRMSRGKPQALKDANVTTSHSSTKFQEAANIPPSPRERSRIHVVPLGKHKPNDNGIDSSNVNFKDLMTQWKNTSPGEISYPEQAPQLRVKNPPDKLHQIQHQQQLRSSAPVSPHPGTKANAANKQEPSQKEESLLSSLSSSNIPSSISISPSTSTSLAPSLSTSTSVAYPASKPHSTTPHAMNSPLSSRHQYQESSPNEATSSEASNWSGTAPNSARSKISFGAPSSTPISPVHYTQSPFSEWDSIVEYTKRKSSSQILPKPSPGIEDLNSTGNTSSQFHPVLGQRSSSDNDIFAEKPQNSHLLDYHKHHLGMSPNRIVQTSPNSQPREGVSKPMNVKPPIRERQTLQNKAQGTTGASNPALETKNIKPGPDTNRLIDDTSVSHKNRPSQQVGMYNRSNSVAGILSSGESNNVQGPENIKTTPVHGSKLGQQSWNSELSLSNSDEAVRSSSIFDKDAKTNQYNKNAKEKINSPTVPLPVPVRPPRPNAPGRHNPRQSPGTPLTSKDNKLCAVSLTALDKLDITSPGSQDQSISMSRPCAEQLINMNGRGLNQPISATRQGNNRTAPPQASPTHNSIQTWQDHCQTPEIAVSIDTARSRIEDIPNGVSNNIPQSRLSPQRRNISTNNPIPQSNSLASSNNQPTTSQSSSQKNADYNRLSLSPKDFDSFSFPTDYQQAQNSKGRARSASSCVEDKPANKNEESAFFSRVRSNSSTSNMPRLRGNSFSFSKRQPSMEELDCDETARQLVDELKGHDGKLLEALKQDANKKRMLYMDGLFCETTSVGDMSSSNYNSLISNQTSVPGSHSSSQVLDNVNSNKLPREHKMSSSSVISDTDSGDCTTNGLETDTGESEKAQLLKHKEELMEKLQKKQEVLKEEKALLEQEIEENGMLGQQVCQLAESKCPNEHERDKLRTHVEEMDKIVRLLLNLSGQLGRVESTVQALAPDAEPKMKKLLLDKRERLHAKHEEAKLLKEDIDRRSEHLLEMLQERLKEQQLADYQQFINMKPKLAIELQELDDKILLGEQQIVALKRSLQDSAGS